MDRLARGALEKMSPWGTASWILNGSREPAFEATLKRARDVAGRLGRKELDPAPVLKHMLRVRLRQRFGVDRLTTRLDPYSKTSVWVFAGWFGFDVNQGGYVPFGHNRAVTRLVREHYETVNPNRSAAAWAKAKVFLRSPSGDDPILVHRFDAPHVYFMRRRDNGQVKIGISIHPGIRRKQLMAELRTPIDIVHIIAAAGPDEEARLHAQFDLCREQGEWFRPEPELLAFLAGLRAAA